MGDRGGWEEGLTGNDEVVRPYHQSFCFCEFWSPNLARGGVQIHHFWSSSSSNSPFRLRSDAFPFGSLKNTSFSSPQKVSF